MEGKGCLLYHIDVCCFFCTCADGWPTFGEKSAQTCYTSASRTVLGQGVGPVHKEYDIEKGSERREIKCKKDSTFLKHPFMQYFPCYGFSSYFVINGAIGCRRNTHFLPLSHLRNTGTFIALILCIYAQV